MEPTQGRIDVVTGEIRRLDETGDTKIMWSSDNEVEKKNAERTFKDLRKKGFLAYTVAKDGSKSEQITEFDPHIERIIFAPPMGGG